MSEKRTQTEIRWNAHPEETDDGHLTEITLVRVTTVYPVTKDGRRQWLRGEATTDRFGPFPADQIPDVITELTGMMLHYANGDRSRDREIERRHERDRANSA